MEKRGKKAQISMEYLSIVGFTLVLVTILTLIQAQQREDSNILIVTSQLDKIARELSDISEEVFYLGKPALTTVKVFMPANIDSVYIGNHTVLFRIRTAGQLTHIERYTNANVTGNISTSQGIKFIKVRSEGNYVCILEDGVVGC